MQNYQNVARYVQLCFIKILPTKPGKSLDYMPSALLKFLLQCGALGFQLRALGFQLRALGSCLQKSINVNKNQRGARYVNCTKKYHCVSTGFGEVK